MKIIENQKSLAPCPTTQAIPARTRPVPFTEARSWSKMMSIHLEFPKPITAALNKNISRKVVGTWNQVVGVFCFSERAVPKNGQH